jgi:CheY-like chemotaxis protein
VAVVLIVEDDLFLREIIQLSLEDLGNETLVASDFDEAMLIVQSSQNIDVLLTDIRLKNEAHGGYEVANQAILRRPAVRVLYMTGNAITPSMSTLFVEGAHSLQKPFRPLQLENALEVLLNVSV